MLCVLLAWRFVHFVGTFGASMSLSHLTTKEAASPPRGGWGGAHPVSALRNEIFKLPRLTTPVSETLYVVTDSKAYLQPSARVFLVSIYLLTLDL